MIKLVGIHKIYEDGNTGFLALKDINLDFKDDHFVCILGKSGSGKTTLLNIIGGLDNPSSGHMVINGELTTKFTTTQWDYFRNYKIGFIFQNFSLIEHLTVLDNVKLAIKLQGIKEQEAKERALAMLEKVHILAQAHKLPSQLSGGERQRVAIARALVNNPEVILADEPTGNLDKKNANEVLKILKEISEEKLVIMVTHNRKIAHTYADRIIELKDGSVVSDTKPYLNEKVKISKPKPKYTKFRFGDKIKHALNNIRMKKWRSFLISLGLAIGVSSFILIDGISNGIRTNIKKYLNGRGSDGDITLIINKEAAPEEIIKIITEEEEVIGVRLNPVNYQVNKVNEVNVNSLQINLSYKFLDDEKENFRLFGRIYGDGHWPTNDNEILVSYNFATTVFNISNIEEIWQKLKGATISIITGYYYEVPMEYVAEVCELYEFIDEQTPPVNYDEGTLGSFQSHIVWQKQLFGKLLLESDNRIYLCQDYTSITKNYTYKPLLHDFTIVGINDASFIQVSFVTEAAYLNIYEFHEHISYNDNYDIYLTDKGRSNTYLIKTSLSEKLKGYDFFIHDNVSSNISIDLFEIFLGMAQFIISMILIVSVVTAGLMLLMLLMISVIERSREIGILRALGATKSDVMSVFITESGVLGFFAGILGIVLSLGSALIANEIIRHKYERILLQTFYRTDINLVIIKPLSCLIAIIISIIFTMMFGLFPAIKASKKTPINALKRL
ncbi:MAG: ATP-binding cassette domain-containing protein [Bacilli bacterium]|nr:ATP-binding cassette domain-containing protein [Bacilli bacterium]